MINCSSRSRRDCKSCALVTNISKILASLLSGQTKAPIPHRKIKVGGKRIKSSRLRIKCSRVRYMHRRRERRDKINFKKETYLLYLKANLNMNRRSQSKLLTRTKIKIKTSNIFKYYRKERLPETTSRRIMTAAREQFRKVKLSTSHSIQRTVKETSPNLLEQLS